MGKVIIIIVILLGISTLFSACEPHDADDIAFNFKNETESVIYLKLFTKLNAGHPSYGTSYAPFEELTISGGGHFTLDSVIIRKTIISNSVLIVTDSIIYRNPKFGDDISQGNHFFNQDRWVQVKENKYLYKLQEADFD